MVRKEDSRYGGPTLKKKKKISLLLQSGPTFFGLQISIVHINNVPDQSERNHNCKFVFTIMVQNQQLEKDSKHDALWQQRLPVWAPNNNMKEETFVDPHNT